ncbi:hypothetical protein DFH06DRAFT_1127951 [Mycena polygramma]|nr:hypothetical protein DFH06DRAFT_1127951 [Mycena polygramma]
MAAGSAAGQRDGAARRGSAVGQRDGAARRGSAAGQRGGAARRGSAAGQRGGAARRGSAAGQRGGAARRGSVTGQHGGAARRGSTAGQRDGAARRGSTTGQRAGADRLLQGRRRLVLQGVRCWSAGGRERERCEGESVIARADGQAGQGRQGRGTGRGKRAGYCAQAAQSAGRAASRQNAGGGWNGGGHRANYWNLEGGGPKSQSDWGAGRGAAANLAEAAGRGKGKLAPVRKILLYFLLLQFFLGQAAQRGRLIILSALFLGQFAQHFASNFPPITQDRHHQYWPDNGVT